jgi:hypothetical protein
MVRIDNLKPGALVLLRFDYGDEPERAVFCGVIGSGEERRARFAQASDDGLLYDWEAYRFGGRWCYGSSAGRLSVVEIVSEFSLVRS